MIFKNALRWGLYEKDDLQIFRYMYPDFPYSFQIALISFDLPPDLSLEEKSILQIELKNVIPDLLGTQVLILDMAKAVLLFLPINEGEENWDRRIKDLQSKLNRETKVGLAFSLSDVFKKEADLFQAWQQVHFLQKASSIDGIINVSKMNNIPKQSQSAPLLIAMLQMIYDSIKSGNEKAACTILQETLSEIPMVNDSALSELIYTMLSNLILLIKMENSSSLASINIPVFAWDQWETLFSKEFPDCITKICKILRGNKERNITKFGKLILDYINDHFDDPQMYIPAISEHFNISNPTLQKIIKNLTGETVSTYIEKIRLKKAWEILTTNSYTLAETAKMSGFTNTNSFYKTFKRVYGFSPGKVSKNSYTKTDIN